MVLLHYLKTQQEWLKKIHNTVKQAAKVGRHLFHFISRWTRGRCVKGQAPTLIWDLNKYDMKGTPNHHQKTPKQIRTFYWNPPDFQIQTPLNLNFITLSKNHLAILTTAGCLKLHFAHELFLVKSCRAQNLTAEERHYIFMHVSFCLPVPQICKMYEINALLKMSIQETQCICSYKTHLYLKTSTNINDCVCMLREEKPKQKQVNVWVWSGKTRKNHIVFFILLLLLLPKLWFTGLILSS